MNEYKNANTLAHSVNDVAGKRFTPRPYNRFSPDDSLWWLVPSSDWPAYKYGKLFFDTHYSLFPGNGIACGFCIEKGLSPKVREFYPKDAILSQDWQWHQFKESASQNLPVLPSERVVTVIASYIPIEKAHYLESPEEFFGQKESFQASKVSFSLSVDHSLGVRGDPILNVKNWEIAEHFKKQIVIQTSFQSLLEHLESFPQSDWSWLDIYIGTAQKNLPASDLWTEQLRPWTTWLGAAD